MRKTLGAALLVLGMLTVEGCGDSLAALNRLAAVITPEGGSYKLSVEWDLLGDARSGGAGGAAQTDRYFPFTLKVAA